MKLRFDNEAMRAEVMKYVSAGMPIENAKRIMEDSGFKCEDSFFTGPPCVRCSAVSGTHGIFLADEVFVLLYHEAGKVTDIKVDCHTVGP
jgi:hypothetical protein